ncbi:6-carboxytetrahydropterin synthase [Oecophyllibacter saccharovorans]|nr:6-carboxytetrahydropterin synthase [Oecophyllibacter saccharovorans]
MTSPDTATPELVFTRRFSMGHRLIAGCSDRCAIPHGHNEYISVTLGAGPANPQAARLDGQANMLLPFAEAKGRWHHFIDTRMDHAFQLGEKDPLLQWFAQNEPSRLDRLVVTPGDPTTELLAALLMAKLNAILKAQGDRLTVRALEIRETPTNTVRLVGSDPAPYLPAVTRPPEACWWHRADDSTRD